MADSEITYSVSASENTAVPLDSTLSVSGMAADAKAVGDAIAELNDVGTAVSEEETAREAADVTLQNAIDVLNGSDTGSVSVTVSNAVSAMKTAILELIFPVGSFFFRDETSGDDPADLLGFGTWERIQNRFLYAAASADDAGTTGGSATSSHTHGDGNTGEVALTVEQIPAHTHGTRNIKGWMQFTNSSCIIASKNSISSVSLLLAGDYSGTNMPSGATATDVSGVCKVGNRSGTKYYRTKSYEAMKNANTGNNTLFVDATHVHDSVGGGAGHSHTISSTTISTMPPYLTVNVWRRTA